MKRASAFAHALCGLALLLTACGDDAGDASAVCASPPCAADCSALTGDSCDILQPGCRERILQAVICVRGTPGVMPEVRTITPAEYRTELEMETEEADSAVPDDFDAGGEPDAGSDGDPWSAGLILLGLLSSEADSTAAAIDEAVDNVAGYYEARARRITLIDRGMPEDSVHAQTLLAHELVHALQDQELGFDELDERTGWARDSLLAMGCLTEGEADLYEELAWALLQGFSLDTGYLDIAIDRHLKFARRSVVTSESPYYSVWQLRYPIGKRYLLDAWLDGGNAQVRSLYRAPPNSSIYWMHGYRAETRNELLVLPLGCDRAAPPFDFEPYSHASMGPLHVFAFLGHVLRDGGLYQSEEAWRDAMHWRQDELTVFTRSDGAIAVSWRMRFDDGALAERLAAELAAVPGIKTQHAGDEIEVMASDDGGTFTHWIGTDASGCPIDP